MPLSDRQALDIYSRAFDGPSIHGLLYDDEDRADTARVIREMIAAPTDEAAFAILSRWGNPLNTIAEARRVRELAREIEGQTHEHP